MDRRDAWRGVVEEMGAMGGVMGGGAQAVAAGAKAEGAMRGWNLEGGREGGWRWQSTAGNLCARWPVGYDDPMVDIMRVCQTYLLC